jgi:hypothetical protein
MDSSITPLRHSGVRHFIKLFFFVADSTQIGAKTRNGDFQLVLSVVVSTSN